MVFLFSEISIVFCRKTDNSNWFFHLHSEFYLIHFDEEGSTVGSFSLENLQIKAHDSNRRKILLRFPSWVFFGFIIICHNQFQDTIKVFFSKTNNSYWVYCVFSTPSEWITPKLLIENFKDSKLKAETCHILLRFLSVSFFGFILINLDHFFSILF